MLIALFDSGVNESRKEIKKNSIVHINTELYRKDNKDNIGHGTAIAFILQRQMKDAKILSFKLFDQDYITTEEDIIDALECIYDNYPEVDFINISNGVVYTKQFERFQSICKKLAQRRCFIISAYDNEGSISYPAAFEDVIGVYWDKHVRNVGEHFYIMNSNVEIFGYAGSQRLPWGEKEYQYVAGSSFIVPYILAKAARFKESRSQVSLKEVKENLKKVAAGVYTAREIYSGDEQACHREKISKIKKAIVFPCNKEIHALIGNSDLLGYQITGIYDYRYSEKIHRTTKEMIFGEKVCDLPIQRFEDIDWNGDFDTIIVGHTDMIRSIMSIDYLEVILQLCLEHKKNCFFFDNIKKYQSIQKQIEAQGNMVMSHYIEHRNVSNFPSGSYHKIASPTLAIVGTSPRQGKYNVQLSLRRRFLMDGYEIGQIGTEPSAQLLGMDLVFSNGYENGYDVTDSEEILYLNEELFRLGNRDLIIAGTQSQTIPFQFGNIGFLTTHQQNVLTALEPDAVILCVNVDDYEDYIRRTICVIENYYMTKIIALVIYPFFRAKEWNIENKIAGKLSVEEEVKIRTEFASKYERPAYINGNLNDLNELYCNCIDFFSE